MDIKFGKPLEGDDLECYRKQNAIVQQYFDWSSLKEDKKYYLDSRYIQMHNVVYAILDTVKGAKGFLLRVTISLPTGADIPDLSSVCGYS